jgi:hypothetical protein
MAERFRCLNIARTNGISANKLLLLSLFIAVYLFWSANDVAACCMACNRLHYNCCTDCKKVSTQIGCSCSSAEKVSSLNEADLAWNPALVDFQFYGMPAATCPFCHHPELFVASIYRPPELLL